jgi:lysophospholipase L1-like esterase
MRNTGVQAFGGLSSDRFLGKLKNVTFSYNEYNNIIIFVGSTNDISEISCKTFQENMKKVIEEIRKCNHSAGIILSSIIPRDLWILKILRCMF